MTVLALSCKAAVAVLLLTAGGAKLADLRGFAASAALFLPGGPASLPARTVAVAVAAGEIAAGALSLSSPQAGWVNLAVLAIGCGFLVVSAAGYLRHPGRPCRCFGALSAREFGLAGIGRAALIALAAGLALRPAGRALVQVSLAGRLGLLAGGCLVAAAAWSAAAALGAGQTGTRWA